jgi:hypothetical protein
MYLDVWNSFDPVIYSLCSCLTPVSFTVRQYCKVYGPACLGTKQCNITYCSVVISELKELCPLVYFLLELMRFYELIQLFFTLS